MRRLQIYIDDQIDDILTVRSQREGRSKASLIREAVREQYDDDREADPLDDWVGAVDAEPGDIDAVVYGE